MNESKVQVGLKKLPIHLQSAQNRVLITGGKIVNDDRIFEADIYVEDGIIKQVGSQLTIPGGVRKIEAKGKMIIPGGIDTHTHFQMQFFGTHSSDDFYTGTKAALAGGTTTIMDFVCPAKNTSLLEMYDKYREWADSKVCCDYALHVIVPHYNDKVSREMELLVRERGINSFKMFLAYPDVFMLEDDELFHIFKRCRELGAIALVHAENGKVIKLRQDELFAEGIVGPEGHLYSRPEETEVEATGRAITIADVVGCPLYVVHVQSAIAARCIADAKREGRLVMGEAIAAALGKDGGEIQHSCWRHAAGFVMSPPLRPSKETPRLLMQALANGDLECTGSDHCVTTSDQKALGKDDFRKIPNGVNGVEDRMSVIWEKGVMSGLLDPCKFVAVTSTNAAKVFNIYPRKGRIDIGSDADLVIWDGDAERTISAAAHHQNVDFNIFEGMKVHGVPLLVMTGGRIVLEDGELKVTQGAGRFVPTLPFTPYVYSKVKQRESIRAVNPVKRQPYTGTIEDDAALSGAHAANEDDKHAPGPEGDTIHTRPPTRGGGRNMQDSSFAFSGVQIDDSQRVRSCVRTHQPPGGASTSLW